jgi:hypothetical protein
MIIPRDTGDAKAFPTPGTWRQGTSNGKKTAFFRCPKCPTFGALAGTHEIADNGQVTPSMVCPNCDFHEWIELEGWQP